MKQDEGGKKNRRARVSLRNKINEVNTETNYDTEEKDQATPGGLNLFRQHQILSGIIKPINGGLDDFRKE